jgi:hypothetical protein
MRCRRAVRCILCGCLTARSHSCAFASRATRRLQNRLQQNLMYLAAVADQQPGAGSAAPGAAGTAGGASAALAR